MQSDSLLSGEAKMAEQHDAVDGAREDTATTPSEATPLLQSNADSRRASSASSSSTAILRDVDTSNHAGPHQQQQQRKQAAADNDDEANYKVSRGRGLAIMISVYILIFLQCKLLHILECQRGLT